MTVTFPQLNYVDGEWVGAVDGTTEKVVNPATAEVLGTIPAGGAADIDRAVAAAKRAFVAWRQTTPGERAEMLFEVADRVKAAGEDISLIESMNVGKPLAQMRYEIPEAIDSLRFFAGAGRMLEGRSVGEYKRGTTSMVRREPLGVVGHINAWNFPLMMAMYKLAPALAAGNTVVMKPSNFTPYTVLKLAELAADVFPPGVFNVITGGGATAGDALVRHPDVRMISLTGETSTGKRVAAAGAATLKHMHLELGGKAPVIVFDDADVEAVARRLKRASFVNSGQACTAASRVIASDKIFDRLTEALAHEVSSLEVGDPLQASTDMGPVATEVHRDRIVGFIDRAVSTRAEVLVGGGQGEGAGFFIQPTILTNVQQSDEIVQREVFGPVVTVQKFSDRDDPVAWANEIDYGLAASVWTSDVSRALSVVRELEFGHVWINDHLSTVREMPFGGMKESGYGREASVYGLDEYTQLKTVMAKFAEE